MPADFKLRNAGSNSYFHFQKHITRQDGAPRKSAPTVSCWICLTTTENASGIPDVGTVTCLPAQIDDSKQNQGLIDAIETVTVPEQAKKMSQRIIRILGSTS